MHSLDDGTSILKRGVVTMSASMHRTTVWYSLLSNWHHPFKLPPYQSHSSMVLSSWILKGSILTSGLNSKMIPFLQNTLTISQTPSGPSISVVYSATLDTSMFRTPAISGYMFSSTHMTIHLQVISARHFGQTKTLHQVHMQYYWSGLPVYVKNYCKSCTTCSHAKPVCHKPYGLLKQLLIPEKPWNSISMDFIEKLPPSSIYTSILVIVDHLSKQSLFIPTHNTITSPQLAQLFILNIFSKHGVPSHVTSNRSTKFVSHFQSLRTALDMKLHFTSGYHPEGDGQTERTNQTLDQYLQVYCNYQQDNWSELLPLAEFAYNNTLSATTGITPFFSNKGYHPNLMVHLECDLASVRTHDFVTDLDELHQQLGQHIANAQRRYQTSADSQRLLATEFKIGSHIYVKDQFFCMTQHSKKLSDKFLGPYEILALPGTHSVTLRLPDSL